VIPVAREEILKSCRSFVIPAFPEQVDGRLVVGFRACGNAGSGRRHHGPFRGLHPRIQIDVLIALLRTGTFEFVLQPLDLAAQPPDLRSLRLDLTRDLEQALILELAFDRGHTLFERIEALALGLGSGGADRQDGNDSKPGDPA
jgi:hypothetical protein